MPAKRFSSPSTSPLEGVSEISWRYFVVAMSTKQDGAARPFKSISDSGGLGAFDMRPRRLVELKYATGLTRKKSAKGRHIYECVFVAPRTQEKFLSNPVTQNVAFCESMAEYHKAMQSGVLKRPKDCSLAGALALLHIGGRGALKSWPKLFENTRAQYERAAKLF